MRVADVLVDIDGIVYATDFNGFDTPMTAYTSAGKQAKFEPWPLWAHLSALSECVVPTRQGVGLSVPAFSRRVFAHSRVSVCLQEDFAPLALWWAGGGAATPKNLGDGWYTCGIVRARLRPWNAGERFMALSHCRSSDETSERFNLSAYLGAMLDASVVALEPSQPLNDLDSSATQSLLNAVIALNMPEAQAAAFPDTPEANRITLRLCKALGWTQDQVWTTPAPELDRVLALLDRVEGEKSRLPIRESGLVQHPDAVEIRIEDD